LSLFGAMALAGTGAAAGMSGASGATTGPSKGGTGLVAVPQGFSPTSLPDAAFEGDASPTTPLTVAFILKVRDLTQLQTEVSGGWHGPYLSVGQFAATYGQPQSVISAISHYLAAFGIQTVPYADHLDITAYGTAEEFNRALSIILGNYRVGGSAGQPGTSTVYAPTAAPKLPANIARDILSVLGLTNYGPFVSGAVRAVGQPIGSRSSTNGTIPKGERTPMNFEQTYHLARFEKQGYTGVGQTIGIVTLASVAPIVPETFWSDYLHLPTAANRILLDNVDGGSGPVSLAKGSDETTLDVEQSGAIAPQARIVVYQAPNTDNGFVDGFYTAASQNVAGSISSSWGESETAIEASVLAGQESATYAEAFNGAFLEMAAQGQSGFIATGDDGAYQDRRDIGTTALAVGAPADSPYITAAGGTTLAGSQTYGVLNAKGKVVGTESVRIPAQLTWGWDYLWPLYKALGLPSEQAAALSVTGGSNGGYSKVFTRPSYQQNVPGVGRFDYREFLRPTAFSTTYGLRLPTSWAYTPAPALGTGTNETGRAVPDLSFDADPQTGYALYDPQFLPVYKTTVEMFGGTSFVAPQLAGTTAIFESVLGHRVGFWNPTIYSAAMSSSSPFTPMNGNGVFGSSFFSQTTAKGVVRPLAGEFVNGNLYYTGQPGTVYNPGSGLGYANLAQLVNFFG